MFLFDFKKRLYLAYQKNEVSEETISRIAALCEKYDLPSDFSVEGLEKIEQPNLLFHGATEKAWDMLKERTPKISIIIPTYNRSDFLCRCVDSVLMQNYDNIEVIIIDDCSTDNTTEVVSEKYGSNKKVIYIKNEKNLGPGGNRQKAYLVSTGEYVVFADDDDYYFDSEFFSKAIALFYDYDNLSMVCANSIFFDEVTKKFDFYPLTFCGTMKKEKFLFAFGNKYRKPNSTFPAVFKKSVLDKADFANMKMMNDMSIYMRAACFGDVCMMKDWVGVYWFHESNISKNLSLDFIIENLDEKNNIYDIACEQLGTKNPQWLLEQQMITITYYMKSEGWRFSKYCKLKKWIKNSGGEIKEELLKAIIQKRKTRK